MTGTPPAIDGVLDDPAWSGAEAATDFVQSNPQPGAPATEKTEVRVVYDGGALYVGARLHDSRPDSIVAQLTRRDVWGYSDQFTVEIDSYHDRRTAFAFEVNPRGVKRDFVISDGGRWDTSWDAVWDVATRIDSAGWAAEIRIPLSQLRFRQGSGEQAWGINFRRGIARRTEAAFWSPIPPTAPGHVSLEGELHGLRGLRSPRRLEVLPYSMGKVTRSPEQAGNPLYRANEGLGLVGADMKYGMTSNFTLTATLNPDFGQVEADPSEVNLTAFETFFPERRPFFTEGSEIFQFGLSTDEWGEQLFYSRRIGRAPQRGAWVPGGFADAPRATTIFGAAKISGKTAGGWSIGLLDAVTAREEARTIDSLGVRGGMPVEPLTNYTVLRVQKHFRKGQSGIGGIFTSTRRRLDEGDGLDFLRSAAYAGGLDARHRFGKGLNHEVKGIVLGSAVLGSEDAIARVQRAAGHYFQRPDADHLEYDSTRTSLSGVNASASVAKIGGRFTWEAQGNLRSPEFEVNDLGYQREADQASVLFRFGYGQPRRGKVFQNWFVAGDEYVAWTLGGERTTTRFNARGSFRLLNNWGMFLGVNRFMEALTPSALRGGPALRSPARYLANVNVFSDHRRRVSGHLFGTVMLEDETDGRLFRLMPNLNVRPSGRLDLSLGPAVTWNTNAWQYVAERKVAGEPHYVLARLEQRQISLTTRLNYTFTPNLSFQLYAQPFISAGDYSDFKEVTDPRAPRFRDRFRIFGKDELAYDSGRRRYRVDLAGDGRTDFMLGDPDFNFRELRSNAVLRWEYRPGSTLFLVWTQSRNNRAPYGSFDFGRDTRDLFAAPGTNILLVKLNYWLNL